MRPRCLLSAAVLAVAACLGSTLAVAQDLGGVCRVTTAGLGSNDGATWAAPMDLDAALATPGCNEIWVAAGVYKPVVPVDANNVTAAERDLSFTVRAGQAVYGGFAGTEASRMERDLQANRSVLSGDIDGNDDVDGEGVVADSSAISGSNSRHVVIMDGTAGSVVTTSTVLDGFVITAGDASAGYQGGGLLCKGQGSGSACSPSLRNLSFSGNRADQGGALYNNGGTSGASSPLLDKVSFFGNHATSGGAVFNNGAAGVSSPGFSNASFNGNGASERGGAIYNYGNNSGEAGPSLSHVTLHGNTAGVGGGVIYNSGEFGSSAPTLSGVILWNAALTGAEIVNNQAQPGIDHSIVRGSGGSSPGWDASLGTDNGGNIDLDPLLGAAAGQAAGGQTLLPGAGSPAIDAAGTCAATDDQRGIPRPQGDSCDIGAVEVREARLSVLVSSATGAVDALQPPIPNGVAIAQCGQGGTTCSAWYSVEPSAPAVTLESSLPGHYIDSATGCGGTVVAGSYVISALTADCTVTLSVSIHSYTLDYHAGPDGSLTGVTSQTVDYGADGSAVTAVPIPGHHFVDWSDGSIANPRIDSNVQANVDVTANFAIDPFTVSTSVSGQGGISPTSVVVNYGATTSFTLSPAWGWKIDAVQGCDGTLDVGTGVFTTGPITADCTVAAVFVMDALTCRVSSAGLAGNDGASWASPLDLQSALVAAPCAEIWVATGIYKPIVAADPGNVTAAERQAHFSIRPGVAVYGGFAGNETTRGERDVAANPTVLSGDIDGNDTVDADGITATLGAALGSNSEHVLVIDGSAAPVDAVTVLDGFTITAGMGGAVRGTRVGGGLYCNGYGTGSICGPTLANLVFHGNSAARGGAIYNDGADGGSSSPVLDGIVFGNNGADFGGALYNNGRSGSSSPQLREVEFRDNSAASGGALFNDGEAGGDSSPQLTDATFKGNTADYGGAIYNDGRAGTSNPSLKRVTLQDNQASRSGGAIFNWGQGNASHAGEASPALVNVTLSGNTAGWGGAIYNDGGNPDDPEAESASSTSSPTLVNVTLHGNSAWFGGAIYNDGRHGGHSVPGMSNVILWGNTAISGGAQVYNLFPGGGVAMSLLDHSLVQGGDAGSQRYDGSTDTAYSTGIGNIDPNPQLGALGDNGGFSLTMLPARTSPIVDAGSCVVAPGVDQREVARPQGAGCDIGAVEVEPPGDLIFVNGFEID